MTLLIDSVILIDHFNAIPAATAYIRMIHSTAAISVITRAEVLTGFDAAGVEKAMPLLDIFPTFDITPEVADLAARLRRENRWKLPDALQAAVAQTHHLKLVTRNTRDFDPAKHPFVSLPYSL